VNASGPHPPNVKLALGGDVKGESGGKQPLSARGRKKPNASDTRHVSAAAPSGHTPSSGVAPPTPQKLGSPMPPPDSNTRVVSAASRSGAGDKAAEVEAKGITSYYGPLAHEAVVARSAVAVNEEFPLSGDSVSPHCFRKLKVLGRGAVGQVYLVQLKENQKLYAMKVLTKEEMVRRNRVKRVMAEREILATVNHPFIVTMYASFQTASRLCFVMEFCEGGEFFRVLQNVPKKRLPEDAARFYAAEVILALEYLHHMGFVYRDLKPENILMRANGHIALTDFDLSKQAVAVSPRVVTRQLSLMDRMKGSLTLKRSDSGSKLHIMDIIDSEPVMLSQTTSFVGTEEYIAPEIINNTAQSASVDWWTLGILIFEMMTGTTPFKGKSTNQTYSNITHNEIHWPPGIEFSHEAKTIMKKLLRREPDKRLGAESGATQIKRERWFSNMNFHLIRNETPPILPRFRNPYDMSQYDEVQSDGDETEDDEMYAQVGQALSKRAQEETLASRTSVGVPPDASQQPDASTQASKTTKPASIVAGGLDLAQAARMEEGTGTPESARKPPKSGRAKKQVVKVEDLISRSAVDADDKGSKSPSTSSHAGDPSSNPFSDFDVTRTNDEIMRKY